MQTDAELIQQARGLFDKGDFAGAEKAYRDLLDVLPEAKHVELELVIGACQQAQGHHEDALETIKRAVEMDTTRAESWFQLGRAQRQKGDEKQATWALQKAITLDPNHALARVERGRQCLATGDTEGADQHFHTALRADPNCVPALVAQAESHFAAGRLDKAQELAAQAVQYQPGSVPAQMIMARIFRHRGHPDFAERCLDNALEVAPRSPDLYAAKAQLLFERGRLEESLEAIGRAGMLGAADARLFRLEFQCLRQLGRLVEARRLLEALAQSQSLGSGDTLALAELRLDTGDPDKADELLEGLAESRPSAAQWMRARLAEREGALDRARELASALHEDEDDYVRTQARLLSGRLALKAGDTSACIEALEPLTQETSTEPKAHWMLARALDREERYEAAGEHLPHTGWFVPPILRERDREMPESLYEAIGKIETDDWPGEVPDDDRPGPVFVFGWPGSGREAVIAALAENGEMATFGPEGAQRRREALGYPARPEQLAGAEDADCRLARKHYLREAGTESSKVLETMWLPVAALPAIGRFLPGSTVIVVNADLHDLQLAWRLSGFRGIDLLSDMWQREQAALDVLIERLPLEFLVFSRADLEKETADVARRLSEALGLANSPGLSAAIERHLESLPPSGHWQRYRHLFEGQSAA